jgi:hypothetical protein
VHFSQCKAAGDRTFCAHSATSAALFTVNNPTLSQTSTKQSPAKPLNKRTSKRARRALRDATRTHDATGPTNEIPPQRAANHRQSLKHHPPATPRRSTPTGGSAVLDQIAESEEETSNDREEKRRHQNKRRKGKAFNYRNKTSHIRPGGPPRTRRHGPDQGNPTHKRRAKNRRSATPPRATQRQSTPAGGAVLDQIAASEEERSNDREEKRRHQK